jgi:hypothetical protein
MAIAYPVNLPSRAPARLVFRAIDVVGVDDSPLTLQQTVYEWEGDRWELDVEVPPMQNRAHAEAWVAFLLKLRGRRGTFLAGHSGYAGARGTWSAGAPQVNGAAAAKLRTLPIKNLAAGATGKEGDWLQLGAGSSSRLHKLLQDFTADGSGNASIEIWPATRAAYSNGDAITLAAPKGLFRLASNAREWSIELAQIYGLRFSAVEDRS